MNNKPLFSVVTVCYNAGNLISKTIESVLAQKTGPESDLKSKGYDTLFEYIIQDGASTDDTLSVVEEYKPLFNEKGIALTVNSGKDGGIYDAMNKASASAKGEYVIFMNADDCFYSDTVLLSVAERLFIHVISDSEDATINASDNNSSSAISDSLPDIIYGDCIVKELGMYFKFRKCFELIKDRMPFSHQACFAKRTLLLESPLNTEYRITADYAFIVKSYLSGRTFFDSDVCIALVTADGLSSVHMLDTFVEVNKVCNDLNIPRFSQDEYLKKLKEMKLKQFVLSYFPKCIKLFIRKSQIKRRGQLAEVTIPKWAES